MHVGIIFGSLVIPAELDPFPTRCRVLLCVWASDVRLPAHLIAVALNHSASNHHESVGQTTVRKTRSVREVILRKYCSITNFQILR